MLAILVSFAKVDIDVGGDVIAGWQWDSREIYPNNEFYLDRVRPEIKVDFDTLSRFSAKISFDIKSEFAELKDVAIEYQYNRAIGIGIGQRRKPFGLEDYIDRFSAPGVDWTELHERFDDAGYLDRDIGCWIGGKLFQEPYQIEYDLGLYNGNGGEAITSEKQFAGRLVYSPTKFLDIMTDYGTGLDTLGLERHGAWGFGAITEYANFELAGEYLAGNDIVTNSKVKGYEFWTRYNSGKFHPYVQYEVSEEAEDVKERFHLGLAFDPIDDVRLRLEATHFDDDGRPQQYTDIKLQAQVKF